MITEVCKNRRLLWAKEKIIDTIRQTFNIICLTSNRLSIIRHNMIDIKIR